MGHEDAGFHARPDYGVLNVAMSDPVRPHVPDDEADQVMSAKTAEQSTSRGLTPDSRAERTKKMLTEADRRDEEAAARDIASDKRSEAADLQAFMDIGAAYQGHGERRAAALDRAHSRSDGEASAKDRAQMSEPNETDE